MEANAPAGSVDVPHSTSLRLAAPSSMPKRSGCAATTILLVDTPRLGGHWHADTTLRLEPGLGEQTRKHRQNRSGDQHKD